MTNPQIITKNGKKEFAVIPYKDYAKMQEIIDDYKDLMDLREAEALEKNAPAVSVDAVIISFNQK